MPALTDVRDISRIAYGFMGSKALFAALDLRVFEHLAEGPKSLSELAAATGIAESLLEALLTACAGLGLVEPDGMRYANAPATEQYLVRSAPRYFGDYFRFQIDRQVYPALQSLGRALVGEPVPGIYTGGFSDPSQATDFTHGQHSGSLGPAYVLARTVELEAARTLLDIGGGSGAFSIMLCQRYPELGSTIIDFPNVLEVARGFVAEAGLGDRIGFRPAGDADWPAGSDVVLMSYLLSAVGRSATHDFLARAFAALAPGGSLLVHDFMVDDDGRGPDLAALWSLTMTVGNPDSAVIRPARLRSQLEEAGFAGIEVQPLIAGITSLMEARRP